jgi:hypothetical protein
MVAASYPVRREDVEGDCGGSAAVNRMPADGAFVVVIDYDQLPVNRREFRDTLPLTSAGLFDRARHANFECFGPSYVLRTLVDRRPFRFTSGSARVQPVSFVTSCSAL